LGVDAVWAWGVSAVWTCGWRKTFITEYQKYFELNIGIKMQIEK